MARTILARKALPKGTDGYNVPLVLYVEGGLCRLGEQRPYFTLTYTQHRAGFPNQCYSGGAGHEHILKHFPRFADLANLHLCDENGEPMHSVANGFYDMAGALGGCGQRFHLGNSERHFPLPPERLDPTKPWKTTEYRQPTRSECLQIFADHLRVSLDEAREIMRDCVKYGGNNPERLKARLADHIATLRPRWKVEADAVRKRHQLVEFNG